MSKISTVLEKVTPESARRMLSNNIKNRRLKPRLVNQLVSDIKSGDFHITHQGIALDKDGNLIDGQHRLSAVIAAGQPVEMYVTRGLDPEMMNVVDIGAKRTQADVLAIHGHGSSIVLSAAATIYNGFLTGAYSETGKGGRYMNNFKLLEFVKQRPELIKAIEWINGNKVVKQLGFSSVLVAFHALLHKKNRNKAIEFFRVLEENHSEKRHHPAVVLNEHILRKRAQGVTVKRIYLMAALIRSWNNFLAGEYASNIVIKDPKQVIKEFK